MELHQRVNGKLTRDDVQGGDPLAWNYLFTSDQGRDRRGLEEPLPVPAPPAPRAASPAALLEEDGALEPAVAVGPHPGEYGSTGSLGAYLTGVRALPQSRIVGLPWSVLPVLGELMPQRFGAAVYAGRLTDSARSRARRRARSMSPVTPAPGPAPLTPHDRALRRDPVKNKGRPRTGTTSTSTTTTTTAAPEAADAAADLGFPPGSVAEVVDIELDDGGDPVIEESTAVPLEVVEPEHLPGAPGAPGADAPPASSTSAPSIAVVTTESEYALDRRMQRETARLNLDVLRRTVTMLQQETNKLAAEREMMTANRDMLRAQVRLVNTDRSRVDSARRKLDLERDLLQSQMLGRALGSAPPLPLQRRPASPPAGTLLEYA